MIISDLAMPVFFTMLFIIFIVVVCRGIDIMYKDETEEVEETEYSSEVLLAPKELNPAFPDYHLKFELQAAPKLGLWKRQGELPIVPKPKEKVPILVPQIGDVKPNAHSALCEAVDARNAHLYEMSSRQFHCEECGAWLESKGDTCSCLGKYMEQSKYWPKFVPVKGKKYIVRHTGEGRAEITAVV